MDYPEQTREHNNRLDISPSPTYKSVKKLVGVDVFLNWDKDERNPESLGRQLENIAGPEFRLSLITNRGVKVYPQGNHQTICADHWRCRFLLSGNESNNHAIGDLLARITNDSLDAVKTENLYEFDGIRGYSQAQGE